MLKSKSRAIFGIISSAFWNFFIEGGGGLMVP